MMMDNQVRIGPYVYHKAFGEWHTMREWEKISGTSASSIYSRMKNEGMTLEEAMTYTLPKAEEKGQPCWACGRTAADCPWMHALVPIDGWDAEEVFLLFGKERAKTYKIKKCPLYIKKVEREVNFYGKEKESNCRNGGSGGGSGSDSGRYNDFSYYSE